MLQKDDLFTTKVRRATRRMHSISDSMVNAKFAISLSNEKVWAGGLLVFYHVFSYLEDAKERWNMPELNNLYMDPILFRKAAFEADLTHYLGDEWRSEPTSEELQTYLLRLEYLEKRRSKSLLAYVYHLYLGLLSGGQILASKRRLFGDMNRREYYKDRVTDFNGADLPQVKRDFKEAMNKIASTMTKAEKEDFITESNKVFELNNSIVSTVKGQGEVVKAWLWKIGVTLFIASGIVIAYKYVK